MTKFNKIINAIITSLIMVVAVGYPAALIGYVWTRLDVLLNISLTYTILIAAMYFLDLLLKKVK